MSRGVEISFELTMATSDKSHLTVSNSYETEGAERAKMEPSPQFSRGQKAKNVLNVRKT